MWDLPSPNLWCPSLQSPSLQRHLQNAQSPVSLQSLEVKTVEFKFEEHGVEEGAEGAEDEDEEEEEEEEEGAEGVKEGAEEDGGAEEGGIEDEGAEEEGIEDEGAEEEGGVEGAAEEEGAEEDLQIKVVLNNHNSLSPPSCITRSERLEVVGGRGG